MTHQPNPSQVKAILQSNGWTTLWSDNFWIKKSALERHPHRIEDLKGLPLFQAFEQFLTDSVGRYR